MTQPLPDSPAASDRTFRGAREVVLVDGESQFRALPTAGPRRCFLHGSVLGEEPGASRTQHWFRQLAAAVPPFRALRYESLGDRGAMVELPAAAPVGPA